jgi:phytol kinase
VSAPIPASDLIGLVSATAATLAVLGIAEALRRRGGPPEATRKLVHFGAGLVAASFPLLFTEVATAALLCAGFAAVMVVTRQRGRLIAVHGVGRPSCGSWGFPLAAVLVFAFSQGRPDWHVAALLVLAVSDALAAVVGTLATRRRYRVWGGTKTLEGSLAFAASAFLCVLLPLSGSGMASLGDAFRQASLVALAAAGIEAVAPRGSDNLLVPLGTLATLQALGTGGVPGIPALPVETLWLVAGLLLGWALGRAGRGRRWALAVSKAGSLGGRPLALGPGRGLAASAVRVLATRS